MANKKNNIKSNFKGIILAIFLVSLVLFYFNYLNNKSGERKTKQQLSELDELLEYDMVSNYPKTARDAIKLHMKFYKVFYGQSVSDEDLAILNSKVRSLYAEELLKYNIENTMLINLKNDIQAMKDADCSYKSFELPEASQMIYYTQKGREMVTGEVKILVAKGSGVGYLYVEYVLVKENDQWKILAWGESKLNNR